jgi:glucose/arabinose dehydrogenase
MSDFLTGFLDGNITIGRPVDIIFDKQGSIFISDDKANRVYKIVKR